MNLTRGQQILEISERTNQDPRTVRVILDGWADLAAESLLQGDNVGLGIALGWINFLPSRVVDGRPQKAWARFRMSYEMFERFNEAHNQESDR